MTQLLLTIDTELSVGQHQSGVSPQDNFASSILGRVPGGEWGVPFQVRRLNDHGLKAVFFVEALCGHVLGIDLLRRIVTPILDAGHEVQLHVHTEWLPWFAQSPLAGRQGWCMADFSLEDQRVLLELGMEALVRAGVPQPKAFRAGNFGANNDTLRAAAALGLGYDTSYNAAFLKDVCRIVAGRPLFDAAPLEGVMELPVTSFYDFGMHHRPAQLCANSISELKMVIDESVAAARRTVVIVSHSFELLNRARSRANRLLVNRFDGLCALLDARKSSVFTRGFADLDTLSLSRGSREEASLRSHPLRTVWRMAEQAMGTLLYEHR